MIELAHIAKQYQDELKQAYSKQMKGIHHQALKQIIACHTPYAIRHKPVPCYIIVMNVKPIAPYIPRVVTDIVPPVSIKVIVIG